MNSESAPFLADALDSRARAGPELPPFPRSPGRWPVAILGVPFDHVTIAEAIERIEAMIATHQPHCVVTANVAFLVEAHRDVELRRILLDADLVVCDGAPIVWASRLLGNRLPERVASPDLTPALMRRAAEKGYRVFFLGGAPGVAEEAAARLKEEFPALQVAGTYAPPFSSLFALNHADMIRHVREANPDILLVSLGCPKQEKWIAMHYRALGVPVAVGVGASVDFLAGRLKRAPAWMRNHGLEWLHRIAGEPRRLLGRYGRNLVHFASALLAQWWRLASSREIIARPQEISFALPDWCSVDAGARLTRRSLEQDAAFWKELPNRRVHCLVNLSKVRRVDGTGLAFLIRWRKFLLERGRQLVLLAPSAVLRRALAAMRLADHFVIANDVAQATQHATTLGGRATVQRDGTLRSLAWCGEIIAANIDDVWRMTTDHILAFVANQATLVVVDLTRLRFIDSSGAALMLRLKKWAQQLHAEILFAHPPPNVRNVLRLTSIDQLVLEGGQ